ncbi:TPA: transcriptional regulator, partial [Escherichia coli]
FSPANKEDCQTINGKRVYTGRKSKLEQHQYSEGNQ